MIFVVVIVGLVLVGLVAWWDFHRAPAPINITVVVPEKSEPSITLADLEASKGTSGPLKYKTTTELKPSRDRIADLLKQTPNSTNL